ncbi:hypothetical protein P171DRAFT_515510 [Karstenula rhodostoma CBS 690.94]|uniref:Uncharacterized protein n=1 Tax=Karstenula rhodostoma CBS 690.94 TaxID=1392251 RepID=A0A9P4PY85_9PLEO|nr:hypothetical protein P171DRAFT_515510 [Karstenula rhodostoma CBS 690.94]
MPPALSEYDSFYESDRDQTSSNSKHAQCSRRSSPKRASGQFPSPTRESLERPSTIASSKKRKRGGLLNGLDAGNIIITPSNDMIVSTAEDNKPSYVPASSYMTRGSARGARSNDLAYDQKYHPIDEYLRPSQAAKRRAQHGLYNEDSSSVSFEEEDSESDPNVEDQQQMKNRKELDKFAAIRRGTRFSSRRINHDVLYNMQIHPQDSQLEQMANTVDEAVEENDEVISIGSSETAEEKDERVVRATTDEASYLTASSPPHSAPLSTSSTNNKVQPSVLLNDLRTEHHGIRSSVSPRVESTPFAMHEEPIHAQPTREATSPVPLDYEHDGKENREEESVRDASPNLIEHYLHSAMFDGPSDRHNCSAKMPVQIGNMDSDSVLGSDIDPLIGE